MKVAEPDITVVAIFGVLTALGISWWASSGWALRFTWWWVPVALVWLLSAYASWLWVCARLRRSTPAKREEKR